MLAPEDYSDTLRALGRGLEQARAAEIWLVARETHLELSWTDRNGVRQWRRYTDVELRELREAAATARGGERTAHRFGAAELLRALGRELATLGARELSITETDEGFAVSAQADGRSFSRIYRYPDLVLRVMEFHQTRRTTREP
jgi:hypothetical protein